MTIDREQAMGILVPKGHNISPEIIGLLKSKGINMGVFNQNGTLHGDFENFDGSWTQVDSGNVIAEVAKGTHFQGGFVGSDFLDEYNASLGEHEIPRVVALACFGLFDERTRLSILVREDEPGDNIQQNRL